MKTFLLNIPQRLKLKSQELDASAALCDKPWTVFNDEGIKQLFIFQPDGTLLITTSGIVSSSTWRYISANKSIIITTDNKSVMFHPAFLDDVVFALQQDGEGLCLFMIDENNTQSFSPKTLTELGTYFTNKERQLVEAEQQKAEAERLRIEATIREEAERLKKEQEEADNKRKAEEERIMAEERLKQRRDEIKKEYAKEIEEIRNKAEEKSRYKYIGFALLLLGIILICVGGINEMNFITVIGGCVCFLALPFIAIGDVVPEDEEKRYIERILQEEGLAPKVFHDSSNPPLYS